VTFEGAYHHVMNRGIKGMDIFRNDIAKDNYLQLLQEKSRKLKIRLLAYCVMDNHYHLILQNNSGKLSDFMKQLNGHYGIIYRQREGGKGYVFQSRYKSTLIQKGVYLRMAIVYVLLNPVRAGIVENPFNYKWSSIYEYFNDRDKGIVDNEFVEDMLQSREVFNYLLKEWSDKKLPVKRTRFGSIIGGEDFKEEALKKYDRREKRDKSRRRRKDDYIFGTEEEVIKNFEEEKRVRLKDIKTHTLKGKVLRAELLVLLKDRSGLKYREIIEYPLFHSLKQSSLGQLYKNAKRRIEEK